jgi:hypothetical protein
MGLGLMAGVEQETGTALELDHRVIGIPDLFRGYLGWILAGHWV